MSKRPGARPDATLVRPVWKETVQPYQAPDTRRALWQLANSVIPYLTLWVLAYWLLAVSTWLTVAVALVAAAFLVRVFIVFHDCGHRSFFRSRKANDTVGYLTGILTFTPYHDWSAEHARHHATAGDLDRRGVGDIWTMTVDEYRAAPWRRRLAYRLYRNPLVMLGVGPVFTFLIKQRLPRRAHGPRGTLSVHLTNLGIAVIFGGLIALLGLRDVLLVQLPIMAAAGAGGIFLFYVQHQFPGVYWERHERRDPVAAAVEGSSFFALPRILQWFSGNIGFHHIHHLSPRIPNYRLEQCFREQQVMQRTHRLTLWQGLATLWLRLYDEERRQLVTFRQATRLAQAA